MVYLQKFTKLPLIKTAEMNVAEVKSHGSPPPGPWPVISTEPVSMGKTIGNRGQNNRWLAYNTLPSMKDRPQ